MTKFFDAMLDIETLGLPPNGALVGLGCVFFDIPSRTLGPKFYRSVNLATSVKAGMAIDPATVVWWLRQSNEARMAIINSTVSLTQALTEFADFVKQTCRIEDVRVWGNSSSFDCTITGNACKLVGVEQPWRWTNERDFRTVRNLYPDVLYDPETQKTGVAHRADDDAVFQAEHLFKIANRKVKS